MGNPYKPCTACKVGRTRGQLCSACSAAQKDKESAWDLGEGKWVNKAGRQVWMPAKPDATAGMRKCKECSTMFEPKKQQVYCRQRCKSVAASRKRQARKKAAVG